MDAWVIIKASARCSFLSSAFISQAVEVTAWGLFLKPHLCLSHLEKLINDIIIKTFKHQN